VEPSIAVLLSRELDGSGLGRIPSSLPPLWTVIWRLVSFQNQTENQNIEMDRAKSNTARLKNSNRNQEFPSEEMRFHAKIFRVARFAQKLKRDDDER
jgi:hypothetical protein